jgi:hypothetical protein
MVYNVLCKQQPLIFLLFNTARIQTDGEVILWLLVSLRSSRYPRTEQLSQFLSVCV